MGKQAQHIEHSLDTEVEALRSLDAPRIAERVEIYDEASKEVLVMSDAIGVKAQRPTRERRTQEPRPEKKPKRISTDLMLMEGREGSFHYLCAGLDESPTLSELARAHIKKEWGEYPEPLPIVAITDGARSIRLMLEGLFGPRVTVILDWYHLSKKAYELLSMVAHSSSQREELQKRLLGSLWHGRVSEALSMLEVVEARNAEALESLVTYLKKHATEIIDYERRKKTGKPVGSGRMEKAVDQAVGLRQKRKGMSWSRSGSRSLAMLRVAELNDQWDELWEEAPTAA